MSPESLGVKMSSSQCLGIDHRYIDMMVTVITVGSTRIVNFVTLGEGVFLIGHGHDISENALYLKSLPFFFYA